jgi:hypothetical protein
MKKTYIFPLIFILTFISNIVYSQSLPSYVPTNGLVGWWGFNGNANDESGNGNNGTVYGAMLTSDRNGNTNSAYSFNSSYSGGSSGNDYIRCINPGPLGQRSRSISFWIKTDSVNTQNSNNSIVNYGSNAIGGQDFRIVFGGYCGANGLAFHNNVGGGGFLKEINANPNNSWDFFTVIFDSSFGGNLNSIFIYKNSQLINSYCYTRNGINIATSGPNPITFGRYHDLSHSNKGFYKGIIDDIGVWNRVLSASEISNLYLGCQLSINTQPSNQTVNLTNNAQFVVNTSNPNASFRWQSDLGFGFQNISSAGQYIGATNDTLVILNVNSTNNNQAFRCIVNSGTCYDTSNTAALYVRNNTNISDIKRESSFSVFPNPAQNIINIKLVDKLIGYAYSMYDGMGRIVLNGILNSELTRIEIDNLTSGIYVFSIGENMTDKCKLIKVQ